MSLSNSAVPRYYGEFRDKVLSGEIPVNEEVSMEMNRIDALIDNPKYYYDDEAVEGFIEFCENELTLTDGSDLNLLDTFKLWAEEIFGWYYFDERTVFEPDPDNHGGRYVNKIIKKRLTKKQYLIVARGAAKSMYASCIQDYYLNADNTTTYQVVTAPTMRQAEETLQPIRTAIARARGPLFKFLTLGSNHNTTGNLSDRQNLTSTKKGIENRLTNSILEVRPMVIDKLQGLRVKCATVDEWLSGEIREDPIDALEQSAAKEQNSYGPNDYLILAISSEGTVRNGIGDTIKMELSSILKGDYYAPHVSIWWYKCDSIEEISNPETWIKAQPNIGITVSYETYQLALERAEQNPSARNDILAKRFGIPMEGFTYYFTYEETLVHRFRNFDGMPCALGADLSRGDDFCSFTFLFPLGNEDYGIKTRNYISSNTMANLPNALRTKYETFMAEGSLVVLEGTTLDMPIVYDDLDNFITRHDYDVRSLGYDPYNSKEFLDRWIIDNGPYCIEKVIQGSKTESVPLGELKKLSEERKLLFDEKLMEFTMGNCVAIVDTNGNRKLHKPRHDKKIDAVAAMMDAYIAYKINREAFE